MFLSIIFFAGCHTQKQRDMSKIQKLINKNNRYVEIIEVFQENYDILDTAIKDQNAAITELGEESIRKINSLESSHKEAIERLNRNNAATIRSARDEAAALRERMVGLSAAEACHEAWLEVAK